MSSLWSMIRKRQEFRYDFESLGGEDPDRLFRVILESQPHLVNISQQAKEYLESSGFTDPMAMDTTPCFPVLWLEWIRNRRYGVLINRILVNEELADTIRLSGKKMMLPFDGSKYLLQQFFFSEFEGFPEYHGFLNFYIDAMGRPLEAVELGAAAGEKKAIEQLSWMVADALTTMNTKGTRIEPPFPERHAQIVKPDRHPCSVWHTIHLPRFARPPLEGTTILPEVLERREHWVRGHRRDYRDGKGMFGRIKALVWVPEFQRGNPELGTVKQSYLVTTRLPTESERKS